MSNITFTPTYSGTPDNPKPIPKGLGIIDLGYGNKVLITDEDHYLKDYPTLEDLKKAGFSSSKHIPFRVKDSPVLGLEVLLKLLKNLGVTHVYDPYTAGIDPAYNDLMATREWKEELKYVLSFNSFVGNDSDNLVSHPLLHR
tara:strand:- start:507 stop:932 length:426 start_codon:yes stop_codon:yes gene_type:complete